MEGLRNLMESIDGPRVVAVETKVEDAVAAVRHLQPSILVVDKGFGAPTVMDWLRLLSTGEKPTAVIVWGTLMSESEALRFLQAGAAGVVRKTSSPLELQVVDLVERGYKNKEIGLTLGIRTGTVKIHLKHIFEKTGIRGRYGLAISGLRNKGLLVAAV